MDDTPGRLGSGPRSSAADDGAVSAPSDDERSDGADGVTLAESYTEMTELLLPNDTNNLGRALGGAVLHWMDICGAIASMRFSSRQCVTASMDHVDFISPIDIGEVAVIEGYVFNTGRTSVDVKVDVRAENPQTGEVRETTSSFFTFVALDDDGSPTTVPELDCPTAEEAALREAALEERRAQMEDVAQRLA
jgi:acyl-CoA hydrolase